MFDNSKLRGRIVEIFGNQGNFAKAIKRSQAFVSNVLNGKALLTQDDIDEWASLLRIPDDELRSYFFTKRVYET